ncbi:MAG: hypothetical protein IJI41_12645 [Anaerolineaceae bacterium]|nr:hypothetical protein [Anaerolineaceae bacterium]
MNLADHSMTFMEPVLPDAEHPCGYRVLGMAYFDDTVDYREKLELLFGRHAIADLQKLEMVRVHPEVKILRQEGQIYLTGDGVAFRISDNQWNEKMLDSLLSGTSFERVFQTLDLPENYAPDVYALMNRMFRGGYLVKM